KFVGNCSILELEGKVAILVVFVFPANVLRVPTHPGWRVMLHVVEREELLNGLQSERVLLQSKNSLGDLRCLAKISFAALMFRSEDVEFATWPATIPITAAGRLRDRVNSGDGAINSRKIDVDARFNQLS